MIQRHASVQTKAATALIAGPLSWTLLVTMMTGCLSLKSLIAADLGLDAYMIQLIAVILMATIGTLSIVGVFGPVLHMGLRDRGLRNVFAYVICGALLGTLTGMAISTILIPYFEFWERGLDSRPGIILGALFGGSSALIGWLIRRPDRD